MHLFFDDLFIMSDLPVISLGISNPIKSKIVGAISANFPFVISISFCVMMQGTMEVVWDVHNYHDLQ